MFYGRVICPFVRSAQVRLFLYCSDDIESVSPRNVHQRYEILIVWSVFLICVKKKKRVKNMNVPECIYNMDDYFLSS